jgi:crotonobetainyl-CoA:carnitine CoA-transferase CaiB-like acyl-CoA transferase
MHVLENIRVIDLTHALAGPMCTHQLVLLGAEVIKIEPPGTGDDFRARPYGRFAAVNAGKKSVVLDLKTEEGRKSLRALIATADVVVENFRAGAAAQLGLDWQQLHQDFPRLISCSISGYGQEGPMSSWPAIEWSVQAISGLSNMYMADREDAMDLGVGILDPFTGYVAFSGILTALLNRQKTNRGERLDVAMLDSAYVLACGSVTGALMGGSDSLGRRPTMARYKARDRRLFIAALHPKWLAKLVELIGAPDLLTDERFSSDALRQKNADAFVHIIEQHLAQRDAAEWETLLIKAGIPAGVVHKIEETASSQNVRDRNLISEVRSETGPVQIVGSGFKMGQESRTIQASVPALGEHTTEVLQSLKQERE